MGKEGAYVNLATKARIELLAQAGRELDAPLGIDGRREPSSESLHFAPLNNPNGSFPLSFCHFRPNWTTSDHTMMIFPAQHVKGLSVK